MEKGETGRAYNVADNASVIKIREIAELIGRIYDLDCTFGNDEIPRINSNVVLDTSSIEGLGWKAMTHMEQGLRKSVELLLI